MVLRPRNVEPRVFCEFSPVLFNSTKKKLVFYVVGPDRSAKMSPGSRQERENEPQGAARSANMSPRKLPGAPALK